jgi:hypothetical protein
VWEGATTRVKECRAEGEGKDARGDVQGGKGQEQGQIPLVSFLLLSLSVPERNYADVRHFNGVFASVSIWRQEQGNAAKKYVIELKGQST